MIFVQHHYKGLWGFIHSCCEESQRCTWLANSPFRKYEILPDNGKISANQARAKAEKIYDEFNKKQKINSDFDKEIRKLYSNKGKEENEF